MIKKLDSNISLWDRLEKAPPKIYQELFEIESILIHSCKPLLPTNPVIIDIASGSGRLFKALSHLSNNIVALDNDITALKNYRIRANGSSVQPLLVHGSAFNLPFLPNTFDMCVLAMAICNFGNKKLRSLKEIVRVLKPGGIVMISTYSEEALKERLKMYHAYNVPIEKIDEQSGLVDFGKNIGTSEQISIEQMHQWCTGVSLQMVGTHTVKGLAHIFILKK